jgi:hypothetical protein
MEDRISTLYKRKVLVKSVSSDLPEPQTSKGRDGYCIKSGLPPGLSASGGLSRDELQGQAAVQCNDVGLCGLLKEIPTARQCFYLSKS